jgi:hypothetical protein
MGKKLTKIVDWTGGRKPSEGEQISILTVICGIAKPISYKIIGTIREPEKPMTPYEIRKQRESDGRLACACLFGVGSGAGYYFS